MAQKHYKKLKDILFLNRCISVLELIFYTTNWLHSCAGNSVAPGSV